MSDTLTLRSSGLMSKWGFNDGDMPEEVGDQIADRFDPWSEEYDRRYRAALGVWHDVLRGLVRDYLLPALDQKVEVYDIDTNHNPIRAESVDGVNVESVHRDPKRAEGWLTPESVAVPMGEVMRRLDAAIEKAAVHV